MRGFLLGLLSFRMSLRVTPRKIIRFLEANGQTSRNNTEFVAPEAVRAACVKLGAHSFKGLRAYLSEMLTQTRTAVEAGAQLVVFPEHVGLLAGTMIPRYERLLAWAAGGSLPESYRDAKFEPRRLAALTEAFHNFIYETYMYTFGTLARLQHIYIVAGTSLFYERGQLYNRCVVFGPDGEPVGSQDKTSPVGVDRALGVFPGDSIEVIQTSMGGLGVVVGSDAYYFECFQIAAAKGARIIAVPGVGKEVLPDLLRCRSEEHNVYTLYSCLSDTPGGTPGTGIFAPGRITPGRHGVVARASGSGVVSARINLRKLDGVPEESAPNPAFLSGDYLHSYRYCGEVGGLRAHHLRGDR